MAKRIGVMMGGCGGLGDGGIRSSSPRFVPESAYHRRIRDQFHPGIRAIRAIRAGALRWRYVGAYHATTSFSELRALQAAKNNP